MGHLEVMHLQYFLPDGRVLLADVSFRVGEGSAVALVGANGAGKTTLLRMIAGELTPHGGGVTVTGGLGVMSQFIGSVRDERTVRDLLVSISPPRVRSAALAVDDAVDVVGVLLVERFVQAELGPPLLDQLLQEFGLVLFFQFPSGAFRRFGNDNRSLDGTQPA